MESPQASAPPGRSAMKIYFCDGCNESIPLADIQAGQATTIKGKLFCRACIPPGGLAAAAPAGPPARSGAGPVTVTVLVLLVAYLAWRDLPARLLAPGDGEALAELESGDQRRAAGLLESDLDQLRTAADELDRKLVFQRADLDGLRAAVADLQRGLEGLRDALDGLQRGQAETGLLIEKLNLQENRARSLEARIDTLADMLAAHEQKLALRVAEVAPAPAAATAPGIDPTLQAELDAIRRQLLDADAGQRFAAVDRIAKGRHKALAADLLPVLQDEDAFVRQLAMQVLGDFGAAEAVPALLDVLEDPNAVIRKAASEALVRLTGYDPGFDPRGSEAERRKAVRKWRDWVGGAR